MLWKWKNRRNTSLGIRPVQGNQNRETRKKQRICWPDEFSVALLIDGDHMSSQSISGLQSYAERLGPLSIQRVYGNWSSGHLVKWQQILAEHRLEPRHCGSVSPGKNAADIALTRDVTLLYTEGMRKFVLVASDSDYTPLVSWLCTNGCLVVVFGSATTPLALQQAASTFHLINHYSLPERQVPVYDRPLPARSGVLSPADRVVGPDSAFEEVTPLSVGATPVQVKQWVLEQLMSYEATPYGWVQFPSFRDALRATFGFRPKAYRYKDIMTFLKAFPDVFELRTSSGQMFVHEVRRVHG